MTDIICIQPTDRHYPPLLRQAFRQPPPLYARGNLSLLCPQDDWRMLCVIGSRKHSRHGQETCNYLIQGLAGQPITLVSGLALGLDACAHDAALKAGLPTIAIIASSLEDSFIYPRANAGLAQSILEHDGLIISMHAREHRPRYHDFPARNVLMATLSQSTLIIEAGEKSGTLITARFALQENRDVLVVPHSILNAAAVGSNSLLRQGAIPVTCAADILESLNLPEQENGRTIFTTFPHTP